MTGENQPIPPGRTPAPGYGSKRTFAQRAGLFAVGIAIGLTFLGFVQCQKQRSRANQPPPADVPAEAAPDAAREPDAAPAESRAPESQPTGIDSGTEPADG